MVSGEQPAEGAATALRSALDAALAEPAPPPAADPTDDRTKFTEIEAALLDIPGALERAHQFTLLAETQLGYTPSARDVRAVAQKFLGAVTLPQMAEARRKLQEAESQRLAALAALDAASGESNDWSNMLANYAGQRQRLAVARAQVLYLDRTISAFVRQGLPQVFASAGEDPRLINIGFSITGAERAKSELERWIEAREQELQKLGEDIKVFARDHNIAPEAVPTLD